MFITAKVYRHTTSDNYSAISQELTAIDQYNRKETFHKIQALGKTQRNLTEIIGLTYCLASIKPWFRKHKIEIEHNCFFASQILEKKDGEYHINPANSKEYSKRLRNLHSLFSNITLTYTKDVDNNIYKQAKEAALLQCQNLQ